MAAIFSGLETESYDREYSDGELIRRIASYFGPYRKRVMTVAFFVTLLLWPGLDSRLSCPEG